MWILTIPGSSHRQTRHPDSFRESGQPRLHLSRMSGHRRSRSIIFVLLLLYCIEYALHKIIQIEHKAWDLKVNA